jgi:hypothetical protein
MSKACVVTGIILWSILTNTSSCVAGPWSKVIREAAEAVGKRTGVMAKEGAEEGVKRTGALVVRYGDDVARPVLSTFGDDGARALNALSPTGAKRLSAMADDLASSGRGEDWMKLIAQRGDEVTDWLWRKRGGVAVGTAAMAVLLQPEEFIQATEHVATATIAGTVAVLPWRLIWMTVLLSGFAWFASKRGLRRMFHDLVNGPWRSM